MSKNEKGKEEKWYNTIIDDSVKEAHYVNYYIIRPGIDDVTIDLGKIVQNPSKQKDDFFVKSRIVMGYKQSKMFIDLLQGVLNDIDKLKKEKKEKRFKDSDISPMHR